MVMILLMMGVMNVNYNVKHIVNYAVKIQFVSFVNKILNWLIINVNQYVVIR